jgi:hypothetical protein
MNGAAATTSGALGDPQVAAGGGTPLPVALRSVDQKRCDWLDRPVKIRPEGSPCPTLPQIVVPALLYNAVLVGLSAAIAWHGIAILQALLRRVRSRRLP